MKARTRTLPSGRSLLLSVVLSTTSSWAQSPPAQQAPTQPAPTQPTPTSPPEPPSSQPAPTDPQAPSAPSAPQSPSSAAAKSTPPSPEAAPTPGESSASQAPSASPEATPSPAPSAEPTAPPAVAPPNAPSSQVPLDDASTATPAATVPAPPTDDYENASSVPLDDSRLEPKNKAEGIKFILAVLYDTGLPLGDTYDFNHRFSGRGFTVEGRFRGYKGLRAGVSFGWQVFQEKVDRTISFGDATVGGIQVRETSLSPITANFAYALEKSETVIPYLRLGVGAGRAWRRLDIGIRRFVDESWHFALIPELGVEIPAGRVLVLGVVRYNHFFKGDGAPAQSYVNFSAGLGFH